MGSFINKALMKRILLNISLFILLFLSLTTVAEERNFSISSNFSECNLAAYNNNSIVTEYADFKYNDQNKELLIEAAFSDAGGILANGFHFGLNSETQASAEGLLTYNSFKLAYFYVDAYGIASGQAPKVNAFIFNRIYQAPSLCNNSPGSWNTNASTDQLTEPILPGTSGYGGNPSWVKFAEVTLSSSGGKTIRAFTIIIDATAIQNFVPNSSDPYLQKVENSSHSGYRNCITNVGISSHPCPGYNDPSRLLDFGNPDVDKQINIDFVPSLISSSSYTEGQLTNLAISTCSFCRAEHKPVNISPVCTSVTQNVQDAYAGEELVIDFNFSDPDTFDTHTAIFNGAPTGANLSPSSGQSLPAGSITKTARLVWTPSDANTGVYSVSASLVQNYGYNQSASNPATCTANVEVLPNRGPVCQEYDRTSIINAVKEKTILLRDLLITADKQILRIRKKAGLKPGQSIKETINTVYAEANDNISATPNVLNYCSERNSGCHQQDFFDEYNFYNLALLKLYCDGKVVTACNFTENLGLKLFRKWKNAKVKFLINVRGFSKSQARRTAKKQVNRKFTVPATQYSSENYQAVVDLVDNYSTIHFTC